MTRILDGKDVAILNIIQSSAKTPHAEVARRVGLAPSAAFERVRKLERSGVIKGYEARVDAAAVGQGQLAFVFVRADEPVGSQRAGQRLAKIPNVLEVHNVAGEDCYLVKVRVRDTAELGRVLREDFARIEHVTSTRSTIVLDTLKETAIVPVAGGE